MRKRLLRAFLPAFLLLLFSNLKAQVYNGDLTLTSQTEVDAFNYTSVTGDLKIQELTPGNITNLNGLSELTSVGRNFFVGGNSALTAISGLSNLASVEGYASIFGNNSLTTIGLNGLTSVRVGLIILLNPALVHINGLSSLSSNEGELQINDNSSLVDVDGLNNLVSLGGELDIDNNPALLNISGLNGLTTLDVDQLHLDNNNALAHIDGFNGLTSIGGDLNLLSLDHLIDLNGFSNLSLIKRNFFVGGNSALTAISGLSNLASVEGSVSISSNTLLTTIGLNGLSSVGGSLFIDLNPALVHINGLSSLSSIGGDLDIESNSSLVDIDGLNNLTSVGGELDINNNPALLNISGLNGLTTLDAGQLHLDNNNALAHIDGFNGLTTITGDLKLVGLAHLIDLNGFSNLSLIKGNFSVGENSVLTIISGLSNLASVEGGVGISSNTLLTTIGLNGLSSVGGSLFIDLNPALVHINGLSSLSSIGGDFYIDKNTALIDIDGLNNLTSIGGKLYITLNTHLANISGLNGLATLGPDQLQMDGNFSLAHIDGFNGLTTIAGDLKLVGLAHLIDVNGFSNLSLVKGNFSVGENSALTTISGLSNLASVEGYVSIISNTSLTTIGLNGLTSVRVGLVILLNTALVHINGLSSLSSNGGELQIIDNSSLVDVDGLENLSTVSGDLTIETNIKLSSFCGLLTLFKNNGLAGSYSVSGNAVNPTKQELIDASHQGPVISDVNVNPATLAPPNHKMRDVTVNYTSTDNCGVESCSLTVTSNEPVNGTGDGDTNPDWEIVDDHHVKLRAERAANGNGRIYTITMTCTDHQGNSTSKTIEVRVAHNITDPQSGKAFIVGSTVNFSGEFWDKPTNKHSGKWLIDDNTSVKGIVTEPTANKNGKVTGSYRFTAAGVYKLQMNTTDQNNIVSYANTNGDLEEIIVVYDPNGGYTYGGGYYNSPAGALKTNPTATGKASYGFAMNYFKNSANPKGETQFEFKVGDFEFNALNFDYLVISNSMAQFKGTGKIIGGQSGVGFTMTVTDGQLDGSSVDKIRMKIYNKNNGSIIYDNQSGASEAALPTQAVGLNSSIVVQNTSNAITQRSVNSEEVITVAKELEVKAIPNPSNDNFTLTVRSNNLKDKIVMQVIDMYGRIVETRNVAAEQTIKLGDKYRSGTYFVRIIQGKSNKEIKLVKLGD